MNEKDRLVHEEIAKYAVIAGFSQPFMRHLWEHPPRCVAALNSDQRRSWIHAIENRKGNLFLGFGCPCGNTVLSVLGHHAQSYYADQQPIFLGPLAIECDACQKVTELMDPRVDGYDGEWGMSVTDTKEGPREAWACPGCQSKSFETVAAFEFSDEPSPNDDEKQRTRPQDFFSWFTLYTRCIGCEAVRVATDFETG